MPTEYYSLLGLPLFTSDKKEIKAAHRRVVKLVHPDILGDTSGALQAIVTEAYETLSDADLRTKYDGMLRKAKPTLAQSRWSEDAPDEPRGLWVDETICARCYHCVDVASSTFEVQPDVERQGKAHVVLQFGDTNEIIVEAVRGCPTKAIKLVSREELPLMEYAMTKTSKMMYRARTDQEKAEVPGPWEFYQDFKIDELIAMDMEKAVAEFEDPLAEARLSEELTDRARDLYQAALTVPREVRAKLWPQMARSDVAAAKVMEDENKQELFSVTGSKRKEQPSSAGQQRAELKAAAFRLFDADGDGLLYDVELRNFASHFGWQGEDADWEREYVNVCGEMGCSAMNGLDMMAFSRLVDDEDACYLSDADLACMVSESGLLPRAGS